MAATNVNNLSGLDAVTGIDAADEVIIKALVGKILAYDRASFAPMLHGVIAAEAFIDTDVGDLRIQLTVATVARINFYQLGANKIKAEGFLWKDGAWSLAVRNEVAEGAFSAYVTP